MFQIALVIPYTILQCEIIYMGFEKIAHNMNKLETYCWLADTIAEDRVASIKPRQREEFFVGGAEHIPHID